MPASPRSARYLFHVTRKMPVLREVEWLGLGVAEGLG